jgi:hypothetical protein
MGMGCLAGNPRNRVILHWMKGDREKKGKERHTKRREEDRDIKRKKERERITKEKQR